MEMEKRDKISKEILDSYILLNNLEIENKYRKDLLKEIDNYSKVWHY